MGEDESTLFGQPEASGFEEEEEAEWKPLFELGELAKGEDDDTEESFLARDWRGEAFSAVAWWGLVEMVSLSMGLRGSC